tara:strand:- start:1143 stop:2654 length:1512 start_codon:yes stop_codon:yes gene_type:complete
MISENFVSIYGKVKKPGIYNLQDNMNLYDLIFKSGGFIDEEFKSEAYLDRAELIRKTNNKKKIIPFNLSKVLEKKDIALELLFPGDIVKIYSHNEIEGESHYVRISGFVKQPGRYELFEDNMKIYDILFKAGGLSDSEFRQKVYLERADLIRYSKNNISKIIIPFNLGKVINSKNHKHNFKLMPGDEIRVYSRETFNSVHSININGSIKNPGRYEFKEGMTIKDIILESGGFKDFVYRYKIEISRIDTSNVEEKKWSDIINIDMLDDFTVSNITYELEEQLDDIRIIRNEFMLQPFDIVSVRPDPYFKMQEKIILGGEVLFPGEYSLRSPDETIYDIIKRAGGLTDNAYGNNSLFRRSGREVKLDITKIIKDRKSKGNLALIDKDEIIIGKYSGTYMISGEVSSTGLFVHRKNLNIRQAIRESGDFTSDANKNDITIIYPNGKTKKQKKWMPALKVEDDSHIIVGRKPPKEKFDLNEYLKEVTGIFADVAQVISIMLIANRSL